MLRSLRLMVIVLLVLAGGAQAFQWQSHPHGYQATQAQSTASSESISVAELPNEARSTLRDIKQGGPFEFDRDGVVFGNFEKALPKQARGYYHEYTVKTPGVRSRGARRLISGAVGEYYYTADHYQTFQRVRE
ncbi:MAG: ribonuclease domain-containing protein [Sideroxydans sp.]|nr:ribonuclease domain-containing protein [Sideroxydans sp.]